MDESGRTRAFQRVLLNTCQEEFEGAEESRKVGAAASLSVLSFCVLAAPEPEGEGHGCMSCAVIRSRRGFASCTTPVPALAHQTQLSDGAHSWTCTASAAEGLKSGQLPTCPAVHTTTSTPRAGAGCRWGRGPRDSCAQAEAAPAGQHPPHRGAVQAEGPGREDRARLRQRSHRGPQGHPQ